LPFPAGGGKGERRIGQLEKGGEGGLWLADFIRPQEREKKKKKKESRRKKTTLLILKREGKRKGKGEIRK